MSNAQIDGENTSDSSSMAAVIKACHVMQFELVENDHQGLDLILTVRYNAQWFHISVRSQDLSSKSEARSTFESFKKRIILNRNQTEEDEEGSTGKNGNSADSNISGEEDVGQETVEKECQTWMLNHCVNTMLRLAPKTSSKENQTLTSWYNTDIHFLDLTSPTHNQRGKDLCVKERKDLDGDEYIRNKLTPHTTLPKTYRTLSGVPWYSPNDITVLAESEDIHLELHPTLVSVIERAETHKDKKQKVQASKGRGKPTTIRHKKCFLKLAPGADENSVIREIKHLHYLARRGLHEHRELRAPRLEGLVAIPNVPHSRAQIMGFLLTPIEGPASPLTHFMTTGVARQKREEWARQCETMIDILHRHGMVWGDAKADNFVVDKDGKLWIIDFGGGYTEGWIEPSPALIGKKSGDKQGLQKITRGMRDPVNGIEQKGLGCDEKASDKPSSAIKKRKRDV